MAYTYLDLFLPCTAVPVAVGHPHHDQEENKEEEDQAWQHVNDGWCRGDGHWGLDFRHPLGS